METRIRRYGDQVAVTLSEGDRSELYWIVKLDGKWTGYHDPSKSSRRMKYILRSCVRHFQAGGFKNDPRD